MVPRPGPMTREFIEESLQRSMTRMQVDQIDAVQFHWWDYTDKRYLDALQHYAELQKMGKIRELNFGLVSVAPCFSNRTI